VSATCEDEDDDELHEEVFRLMIRQKLEMYENGMRFLDENSMMTSLSPVNFVFIEY
jgi:hypothetical protein